MKILVAGANGFLGRNLCEALKAVRDGKDGRYPEMAIESVFAYTRQSTDEALTEYVKQADFVFYFAGVNRVEDPWDYMAENCGALRVLLDRLKQAGNSCPFLLASSQQATMEGRFANSEYGRSKRAMENMLWAYGEETGAKTMVYRFPNVFGKWCRPNYNSVIATFCHNIARGLPITVKDPAQELELLYIDDLVQEMMLALVGKENWVSGKFCAVPGIYRITLGKIAACLEFFRAQSDARCVPMLAAGSFEKKLYATYLSYLPENAILYPLQTHQDARGSFTELLRLGEGGQVSVNVSRPGAVKGMHWHHTKSEIFAVVSGRGLIRMRQLGGEKVISFEVSGKKIQAVQMLPGYVHELINLSDRDDLITVIWASEPFEPERPDTFRESVDAGESKQRER